MRAHQRMRAAGGRLDAELRGDELRAFFQRAGGDDEMIEFQRMSSHGKPADENGADSITLRVRAPHALAESTNVAPNHHAQ